MVTACVGGGQGYIAGVIEEYSVKLLMEYIILTRGIFHAFEARLYFLSKIILVE